MEALPVYLTRSKSRYIINAPRGSINPAIFRAACHLNPLLQAAIRDEDLRDQRDLGDVEEGQALVYPPSPSLSSANGSDSPLSSAPSTPSSAPESSCIAASSIGLDADVLLLEPVTDSSPPPGEYRRCAKQRVQSIPANMPSLALKPESLNAANAPPAAGNPGAQEAKKKRGSGERRRKRRAWAELQKAENTNTTPLYKVRPSFANRKREEKVVNSVFNAAHLRAAQGGYIGLRQPIVRRYHTLQELLDQGYDLIEWDGREPVLLLDEEDRIIAVLVGHPVGDETWDDVVRRFEAAMEVAHDELRFGKRCDRRGNFRTIATGVSYGGGQTRPGNLRHSAHNVEVMQRLMANPAVIRVANFANAAFARFAPKLHQDYHTVLNSLYAHYPGLQHNFPKSVFPAASWNFGPNSFSYDHADHGNCANGWCSIFSAGNFDPVIGGHLVLQELRLVIQFPSGSTVLIPSATCIHGNIPVRPQESRTSFTQYASGGLFRYVKYGFRSWKRLQAEDAALAKKVDAERSSRWEQELKFFSRLSELHADRAAVASAL